jgi:hypothetical protein
METKVNSISDLFLVAYLISIGIKPVSKVVEGHNTLFLFTSSPELEKEIDKYYAGGTTVDALAYAEKYRFVIGVAKGFRSQGRNRP